MTTIDVVPMVLSDNFNSKVALEDPGVLWISNVSIKVVSRVVAVKRTFCFSPPPGEMLFSETICTSEVRVCWSEIFARVGKWLLGEISQPTSSILARSSFVNSFRSPTVRLGSIAVSCDEFVSINWLSIPSSQCALSLNKGTGAPYSATDRGPANLPDELMRFIHELEIPIPNTCAIS